MKDEDFRAEARAIRDAHHRRDQRSRMPTDVDLADGDLTLVVVDHGSAELRRAYRRAGYADQVVRP